MLRKILAAGMVLAAFSAAQAAVGDLEYVAVPTSKAFRAHRFFAYNQMFRRPEAHAGTVNPHAMVVTFPDKGVSLSVAVDSGDPNASLPDLLRLDFSGKGRFDEAIAVPLKVPATGAEGIGAPIGPVTVQVRQGNRVVPVEVTGTYRKSGTYRMLELSLGAGAKGLCGFGDKTYPVTVIDGGGNLRLGDRAEPVVRAGKVVGWKPGDTLRIDVSGEAGADEVKGLRIYCGQPVLIDGKWYDVKISDEGTKVAAEQISPETGKLQVPHASWQAVFVSDKYVFLSHRDDDMEPLELPAGKYWVGTYKEFSGWRGSLKMEERNSLELGMRVPFFPEFIPFTGKEPTLQVPGGAICITIAANIAGREPTLQVPGGATGTVAIGSPITVRPKAEVREKGIVILTLELREASGSNIEVFVLLSGGRRPQPNVRILDSGGKEVYGCTLEYG
jgi:hypothetical protein